LGVRSSAARWIVARVDDAEVVRQPFEYELAERFAALFRRRRLWHLRVTHARVCDVSLSFAG
jgi:hypothetical protein